jgi:chemotaxis protein methyltransferase CheR
MTDYADLFAGLLEKRTGIRLARTNVKRVAGVLRARAETLGFASVRAYVEHLDKSDASPELQTLTNLVTVGKTQFFRYADIMSAVTDVLVPELHARLPRERSIDIWSVGCSTGEEPYSIAMALDTAGWFEKRRFRIVGTDINTASLEQARSGKYWMPSTKRLPKLVNQYADYEAHTLSLHADLMKRVSFDRFNLALDPVPSAGHWHIVICANVLIYFDSIQAARAFNALSRSITDEGTLFLGGGESLAPYGLSSASLRRFGGAYAYQRGPQLESYKVEKTPPKPTPALPKPPAAPLDPSVTLDRALAKARGGDRATAIVDLIALNESHPDEPRVSRALAMLLFNERRFEESCAMLDEAITSDPLAFDLYFYAGWMHLALGDVDAAHHALRRALFLEPGFTFARYELALTMHRAGKFDDAAREYARAEQSASDPLVRTRLKERAAGTNETFWIDDTFIVELCRSNRDRAKRRLTPIVSARIP